MILEPGTRFALRVVLLRKAAQLGLFGGPPQTAGAQTTSVRSHIAQGKHGAYLVTKHDRHLPGQAVSPEVRRAQTTDKLHETRVRNALADLDKRAYSCWKREEFAKVHSELEEVEAKIRAWALPTELYDVAEAVRRKLVRFRADAEEARAASRAQPLLKPEKSGALVGYERELALMRALNKGERAAAGPSPLHVHAALVDGDLQQSGHRLETLHARLLHQAEAASSPLEREHLRKQAYEVHETAGAIRYSAVTGRDDSDLG